MCFLLKFIVLVGVHTPACCWSYNVWVCYITLCIYVCIYVYIYNYIYICKYIYIYNIYIYIYNIYIYNIYIYTIYIYTQYIYVYIYIYCIYIYTYSIPLYHIQSKFIPTAYSMSLQQLRPLERHGFKHHRSHESGGALVRYRGGSLRHHHLLVRHGIHRPWVIQWGSIISYRHNV